MYKSPFSPVSLAAVFVGLLTLTYIGLIAVVISYAAFTIEFSQSVKNDEAAVAALEGQYLAGVAHITSTDYTAQGYVVPSTKIFVKSAGVTALR